MVLVWWIIQITAVFHVRSIPAEPTFRVIGFSRLRFFRIVIAWVYWRSIKMSLSVRTIFIDVEILRPITASPPINISDIGDAVF